MKNNNIGLKNLYKSFLRLLTPSLSLEETYKIIVLETVKLVKAEYGSLFLRKDGKLQRIYATSPRLFKTKIRQTGYTYRASKTEKPQVIDIDKVEKVHPRVKDMGVKSTIFIPLNYKNQSFGVLSADSFENKKFTGKELDVLKLFGSMATLAIRKAQLNNELKDSLETRDLFISIASHELKTPLTTINLYAELIEKKLSNKPRSELYKWGKVQTAEITRLTLMVNELLHLDQIKKGALEYNWKLVSLTKLIERAIVNFKAQYQNHQIEFENKLKKKDMVMADFDKLLEAVLNILTNAAKFSAKNSEIEIKLYSQSPHNIVSITDHGRGIAEEEVAKIFEKFYKGKQGKDGGLGIGLYLTKTIIEMHRGKINVFSKVGKGTTFEVKLLKLKQ